MRGLACMMALGLMLLALPAPAERLPVREEAVTAEARSGFEELLDLWRAENFEALASRVIPGGTGYQSFLVQMAYASRIPACCWEKLQQVSVVYLADDRVSLTAKLGLEVEGVGTRFVTRSFLLVKEGGVWKVPATDILSLAEPNMQRIPRKIPLRVE